MIFEFNIFLQFVRAHVHSVLSVLFLIVFFFFSSVLKIVTDYSLVVGQKNLQIKNWIKKNHHVYKSYEQHEKQKNTNWF